MKPPESFVPLTAAAAPSAPREFQVAILNRHNHGESPANGAAAAESGTGFQALETQRPAAFTAPGGERKVGEPRVTVQRDGDRVTHIRIQCTCGQIIELACAYDAPASAA